MTLLFYGLKLNELTLAQLIFKKLLAILQLSSTRIRVFSSMKEIDMFDIERTDLIVVFDERIDLEVCLVNLSNAGGPSEKDDLSKKLIILVACKAKYWLNVDHGESFFLIQINSLIHGV